MEDYPPIHQLVVSLQAGASLDVLLLEEWVHQIPNLKEVPWNKG